MVNYNKSMMRNNKSFIFLLAFAMLFLLSNVSATTLDSYGSKKVNEQFTFTQVCSDATYITLSSIDTPTGVVYLNVNMSNIGLGQYSYNYTPTEIGRYDFRGISDGCEQTFATYVEATATGKDLNSSKATLYIIILIVSILLMVFLISVGIAAPYNNKTDEMSGYILAVSNIKYLKLVSLGVGYVFGVFVAYLCWMLTYAYLDMEFLSNIFRFIFTAMAVSTLPLFILFVYLTITNLIRDSKISEALTRGLRIRE